VSKATGGRTPDQYTAAQMGAAHLAHITLGTGVIAGIAIVAVTLAPAFVPRATAALTSAGLLALVVLLLAPGVPREIFDLTGLGRVLWRLTWPLPVAASVGALAVCLPDGRGGRVGRLAPAHAVCLVLALSGTPRWTHGRHAIAAGPVLKRAPADLAAARVALAVARPGDVVLASERVSQTVLVLSGEVTTVHPRGFLTWRLNEEPGFAPVARRRLGRFAEGAPPPPAPQLEADLRAVGVDVACLRAARGDDIRALADAGFTVATHAKGLACLRSLRVASGR
jgi:hypothetical protein